MKQNLFLLVSHPLSLLDCNCCTMVLLTKLSADNYYNFKLVEVQLKKYIHLYQHLAWRITEIKFLYSLSKTENSQIC